MAAGLADLGIGRGDRLCMLSENGPEYLLLMMAASRLGSVVVPLNYRLATPELAYIIKDARAKLMFVPDPIMNPALAALKPLLPEAIQIIAAQGAAGLEWQPWLAAQEKAFCQQEVDRQSPFLQLYTSGTTGDPKGVVSSHMSVHSMFVANKVASPISPAPGIVGLLCAPNFHISGTAGMLLTAMGGGFALLHKSFDPAAVADALTSKSVSSAIMVPAMIMALFQHVPDIEAYDFSSVELIFYGASPISPPLLKRAMQIFSNASFAQAYGMTETLGTVVALMPEDHLRALNGEEHLLLSCGRELPGVEVKIMDADGRELPSGETGELWIKSDQNLLEYYNLPEATATSLTDGWVHTGDSGYKDEEGFIYLRDRIKDLVVSGGENIYPIEVENVLAELPQIQDVAVIGVPDDKFGEALLACVALAPGQSLTEEAMIEFCRPHLAGYKIPRRLQLMDALPRNPSGKIMKRKLRAPHWEGRKRVI